MSIDRIESLGATEDRFFLPVATDAVQPFSSQLKTEFESVNKKMHVAESGLLDLATGKQGNIHHVMLALEDARLSFQLLAQVRNKVLESYQEILRMQL